MLQLFRTNQIFANLFLLFYIAFLKLSTFIFPHEAATIGGGVWAEGIYQLTGDSGAIPQVLSIFLIFFQAVLLNNLVANYRMAKEVTLFPGLFYALVLCIFPQNANWSPVLFGLGFYILAITELFATYKKNNCADHIFNTGVGISVASLFYFPFILFFLLGTIGLNILRAFRFKERLMFFSGLIVPYLLVSVYFFWMDDLAGFWQRQVFSNFQWGHFSSITHWEEYAILIFFALLILISLFSVGKYNSKKNIQVQKYISILFWGLFLGGVSVVMQVGVGVGVEHVLVVSVPLAVFLSLSFLELSRNWAEAIHLLFLFMALFFQYKTLIAA